MTWMCANCCLEFNEPFCAFCGANLMPKRPIKRPELLAAGKEKP